MTLCVIILDISTRAQVLIPYRDGHQWGLANDSLDVVVSPQYDSIVIERSVYYREPFCVVLKDGKYGVVSKDSVLIPPQLNSPKILTNPMFVLDEVGPSPSGHAKKIVYNRNGQRLFNDTLLEFSRIFRQYVSSENRGTSKDHSHKELYVLTHKDGLKSVVSFNAQTQEVEQWLLKRKEHIEISGNDQKAYLSIYHRYFNSPLLITVPQYVWTVDGSKVSAKTAPPKPKPVKGYYEVHYDRKKGRYVLWGMFQEAVDQHFASIGLPWQQPYYGCGGTYDMGGYTTPPSRHFIFSEVNNEVVLITRSNYGWLRQYNTVYGLEKQEDTVSIGSITSLKSSIRNYKGRSPIAPVNPVFQSNIWYHNYVEYTHRGKKGFISPLGAVEAKYDSITGMLWQGKLYFVVGQLGEDGRYSFGLVDVKGTPVLPIKYQSIRDTGVTQNEIEYLTVVDANGVHLYKDGKLGQAYDEVLPLDHEFTRISVKKDGKYGLIGHVALDPLFTDRVIGQQKIFGTPYWILVDNNGRFTGYGNDKGRVFYTKKGD